MAGNKYNLTEKKQKNPLYRTLVNPQLVEELYQKIMARSSPRSSRPTAAI